MKRNWDAIRAIPCRATQIALAVCSVAAVLKCLQKAFPQCFAKGEETAVLGAWSGILDVDRRYYADTFQTATYPTWSRMFQWGESCELPFSLEFGRVGLRGDQLKDGPVPEEVLAQVNLLELSKNASPLIVTYLGREWIIAKMEDSSCNASTPDEEGGFLVLVPKEHVVLDL